MTTGPKKKRNVRASKLWRALAGLLAIGCLVVIPDSLRLLVESDEKARAAFVLVSCIFCVVVFGFYSVRGREPLLFSRYTNVIDSELTREVRREDSSWIGSQLFAIVPFGIATGLAFFFLAKDVVFENQAQTAWFVYCLFLLAWLVLMALFLVYSKYSFEKLKNQDSGQIDSEY
jgi:hypothetical protein